MSHIAHTIGTQELLKRILGGRLKAVHDGGVPQHHPLPSQREHHSPQSCHHLVRFKFKGAKCMVGLILYLLGRKRSNILLAPGEKPHQGLLPNHLHLRWTNYFQFFVEFSPPPSSSLLGCSQTRPLLPRMIEAPIGNWWK